MKNNSSLTVLALFGMLAACTGRSVRPFVASDGAVGSDGALDAGPVFSSNCPAAAVFDHMTCTSSTNGSVCAGTQFCDSCSMTVATSCTCMPYTEGFEFRCADPCEGCGSIPDAGASDAGAGVDSGSSDPCATDTPSSTVGCNGGVLGSDVAPGEFGGLCTEDGVTMHGSCHDFSSYCLTNGGAIGICIPECFAGPTPISTGDCPTGSRCFRGGGSAFCFPDCHSASDCTSGVCDGDGSCAPPGA